MVGSISKNQVLVCSRANPPNSNNNQGLVGAEIVKNTKVDRMASDEALVSNKSTQVPMSSRLVAGHTLHI